MLDFAKNMSDEQLIDVVQAIDRVSKPLPERFEGDDAPIVELMSQLGLKQTIVDKLLITGEVLRECAHRGLQIPRPNSLGYASEETKDSSFRP